ncbi:hypothetical protein HNQ56_000647 [Anaerotaenia torta]|uniref:hypothetical protein n=1 Tax=Anaerotaenia torta TaxID=433293 RepID=UPI003D1F0E65
MDKRDEEKRKINEYRKHPMLNFSAGINRSMHGEIGIRTKEKFLVRTIISLVVLVILYVIAKLSKGA